MKFNLILPGFVAELDWDVVCDDPWTLVRILRKYFAVLEVVALGAVKFDAELGITGLKLNWLLLLFTGIWFEASKCASVLLLLELGLFKIVVRADALGTFLEEAVFERTLRFAWLLSVDKVDVDDCIADAAVRDLVLRCSCFLSVSVSK